MKFLVIFVLQILNVIISFTLILACRFGIQMNDGEFYFYIFAVMAINFFIVYLFPGVKSFVEDAMN